MTRAGRLRGAAPNRISAIVDVLVTDARAELDPRFVLKPMPAESVNGIAEPVATHAVLALSPSPEGLPAAHPTPGRTSGGGGT